MIDIKNFTLLASLGSTIEEFFSRIFYGLIWLIFKITETIEQVFLAFLGIKTSGPFEKFDPVSALFDKMLNPNKHISPSIQSQGNSTSNEISKFFLIVLAISLAIFVLAITIKAIRNAKSGQVHAKNKKLVGSSAKAVVRMIVIPFLFIFAFFISTQLIGVIYKLLASGNASGSQSVTFTSFKSFFSDKPDPTNRHQSIYDPEKFKAVFPTLNSLEAFKDFDTLHYSLGGSDSKGYWYLAFRTKNFSYFMAFTTGLVLCYVMFRTAVKAARRLFDIIILYFTVPFVSSLTPMDDGKAFDTWKKNATSKFFSIFGILFSFFIFIIIQNIFTKIIAELDIPSLAKLILKLVILAANSFLLIKGENFISDYIGQGSDSSADDIQSSSSQAAPATAAAGAVGGSATMAAAKLKQGELERKLYPNGKVLGAKLKGKDNSKSGKFSAKGIGGKDPNKKPGLFSGLSGKTNKLSIKNKFDDQKKKPGKPKDKFGKLESHVKRKEQHDRNFNLSELNRTKRLISEESKKLKSQQTQAKLKNVGNKLKSAGSKALKNAEKNFDSSAESSTLDSESE